MSELTGRRRYRRIKMLNEVGQWQDALTTQVEVTAFVTGREDKQGRWVCEWRDANPSDLVGETIV